MLHERVLQFFAQYIESELGIVYAKDNYFQLENRLEDIARQLGVSDLFALYEQGKAGISGPFKQLLLDVATNNETSFFRDPKVFKIIEQTISNPDTSPLVTGERLRIWSAASSTGQEALSVAIMLTEYNKRALHPVDFSILATDISERVLTKAKSGIYTQLEVQRGLPAPLMIKYFTKKDQDQWAVSPEILRRIEYGKVNLREKFGLSGEFHLILCRNILIYQSVEGKKDILSRITEALRPGGYLILGAGESLLGLSSDYEHKSDEGAIIYRKRPSLRAA